MANRENYPIFHFTPIQLQKERERLSKKYKQADKMSDRMTRIKLPDLLKRVRQLNNKEEKVLEFARSLKPNEINILATEYPYEQESEDTIQKVVLILTDRCNQTVGRRFWTHFQSNPFDQNIKIILRQAFAMQKDFLSVTADIKHNYKQALASNETLHDLAHFITEEKNALESSFEKWKIKSESRLARELWELILPSYIQYSWFIQAQGVSDLTDRLENYRLDTYQRILNNYLSAFEWDQLHPAFIYQAINRLKDPRVSDSRWQQLSENAIRKVKMWLYDYEMYDFFDSDRFKYWRGYLRHIKDLKVIKNPPIAVMYFGDFVVVEFDNIGNAAYFYEKEGFTAFLAPKLSSSYIAGNMLKDRNADFFIYKLNHSGDWHSRFNEYMTHYLRGDFWYRH